MRVCPPSVLLAGCVLLLMQAEASAEPTLEVSAVLNAEVAAEPNLRLSMVRIVEAEKPIAASQTAPARRKDSSVNGALIGAAVGGGYGIVVALNVPETDPGAMIIMSTTMGLLVGWLIDELR